jgi:uncharacterized FlaG/YvyC family protein
MEIDPLNRVGMNAPVTTLSPAVAAPADSQIVAAVQRLNKSELSIEDRELRYRRDPNTNRLMTELVERSTGDVVDQIPPETVLRLYAELQAATKLKEPQA